MSTLAARGEILINSSVGLGGLGGLGGVERPAMGDITENDDVGMNHIIQPGDVIPPIMTKGEGRD